MVNPLRQPIRGQLHLVAPVENLNYFFTGIHHFLKEGFQAYQNDSRLQHENEKGQGLSPVHPDPNGTSEFVP